MSALAGLVGGPERLRNEAVRSALREQRDYGVIPDRLGSLTDATFGIRAASFVPEDVNDHQPLVGAGGRLLLLADVRLDNRADLLTTLREPPPSSAADSEILLRLWEQHGEQALNLIAGPFALAAWDCDTAELRLARDITGQRPLMAAVLASHTLFGSTPKGIFGHRLLPLRWNKERVALLLSGVHPDDEQTCFEQVRRVRPGHVVTIKHGHWSSRRFWTGTSERLRCSDGEFADLYRSHLRTVVSAQLRSTGRVGAYVSSGYDSSAVAATAATLQSEPLVAITGAPHHVDAGYLPRGRFADESAFAAKTAELHGMKHVVVRSEGTALRLLRRHSHLYQEPARNIANMDWFSAAGRAACERGVTVLFDAHMGNLTLHTTGLPVLRDWLAQGEWIGWLRAAGGVWRHSDARLRGILYNSFGANLPAWLEQRLLRGAGLAGARRAEERFVQPAWFAARPMADLDAAAEPFPQPYRERREHIARIDMGLLRKGTLAEWGIDERDPTADPRIIDFSLSLPPEQLLHDGRWRPLARRALSGLVPDEVLDLRKRGYQGADWAEHFEEGEARQLLDEIATCGSAASLLDLGELRRACAEVGAGRPSPEADRLYRQRFLGALAFGVFMQEFERLYGAGQAARAA